jgi:hypothetical protein
MTPLKAEYIGADQLPFFIFRLQRRGGPYIPISRRIIKGRPFGVGLIVRINAYREEHPYE